MTVIEAVQKALQNETNDYTNWSAFGKTVGLPGDHLKKIKDGKVKSISTTTAQTIFDKFGYNIEINK